MARVACGTAPFLVTALVIGSDLGCTAACTPPAQNRVELTGNATVHAAHVPSRSVGAEVSRQNAPIPSSPRRLRETFPFRADPTSRCELTDLTFGDAPPARLKDAVGGLKAGEWVLAKASGQQACVYADLDGSLVARTVPATLLSVEEMPTKPVQAVVGTWREGGGESKGGADLTFDTDGKAHGVAAHVMHPGDPMRESRDEAFFDGAWLNVASNLMVAEGNCRISLELRGPFLLVADDGECGGVQARFMGIFVRAR